MPRKKTQYKKQIYGSQEQLSSLQDWEKELELGYIKPFFKTTSGALVEFSWYSPQGFAVRLHLAAHNIHKEQWGIDRDDLVHFESLEDVAQYIEAEKTPAEIMGVISKGYSG